MARVVPERKNKPATPEGKRLQKQVRGVGLAVTQDRVRATETAAIATPLLDTKMLPSGILGPAGYRLCDGSEVPRQTIPEAIRADPSVFGPGDGSTTVDLPDLTAFQPAGFRFWIYTIR